MKTTIEVTRKLLTADGRHVQDAVLTVTVEGKVRRHGIEDLLSYVEGQDIELTSAEEDAAHEKLLREQDEADRCAAEDAWDGERKYGRHGEAA